MLLCLNMTPGDETARTGQDRTVLGDASRVSDVTGKAKKKRGRKPELPLWCFVAKNMAAKKGADRLLFFLGGGGSLFPGY